MKQKLIQLVDITKSYERGILDQLNLTIYDNDYLSIVGASGSGKSTLTHILGLMDTYESGNYYFKSQKLNPKKDYYTIRNESIGFIFQSYNLIDNLSSLDNILLPITFKNIDVDHIHLESLINRLKIREILDKNVSLLSGGEKQRVAICRALLLNPDIIIADEPTGNLDNDNEETVFNLFKSLHQEGKTIIVITHNFHRAQEAVTQYQLENGQFHVKSH